MCFSNLWGLIEESQWGSSDAKVICEQLGYGAEGMCKYSHQIFNQKVIVNV